MSQVPRGPVNRQSSMSRSARRLHHLGDLGVGQHPDAAALADPVDRHVEPRGLLEDHAERLGPLHGGNLGAPAYRRRGRCAERRRRGRGRARPGRARRAPARRGGGLRRRWCRSQSVLQDRQVRRVREVRQVRCFGQGSRLWCTRLGCTPVRSRQVPRTGVRLRGVSWPQQHLPDLRIAGSHQLDGLRRTRSNGSSCVTSGSGSSSPAPKTRTVCAQASGGRTEHGVHLQLAYDEIASGRARRRPPPGSRSGPAGRRAAAGRRR